MDKLSSIEGKLIVSCQALEDEALHSSFIMSKMALAAYMGGAAGIRANGVEDIKAIKKEVNLPIIGIIKKQYPNSDIKITPTMKEVEILYGENVDIIAFDATDRVRPNGESVKAFIEKVKQTYPDQVLMADISTVEEAIMAEKCGVDFVGTTLVGYTNYTVEDNSLEVLEEIIRRINIPVIAEGNFDTPEKAKKAIEIGAYAVVVGSAITRPTCITQKFVEQLK
ncbi:N-acetylmannosamine-6-phosphate 2-epimerase [Natronincola ferrireducens]|uniref:Putative N-acetylmannosamine-6-phosphate 2-epimerase n=1 Tax=Natronincola ferrireducens TaxID=393762 RepID=A0A1G9A5V9_9FIRM|nr:N-acetylmannosamine-6-phosphate 2-epimerase [Natronincola ferrireducens]SDK22683.1 N-acylglucosamine-6-phosphate 2-epimerase [Natronincola ferrireducens]